MRYPLILATQLIPSMAKAGGNLSCGKRAFLKHLMCNSVEPESHMTGTSLAGIWGREAATASPLFSEASLIFHAFSSKVSNNELSTRT